MTAKNNFRAKIRRTFTSILPVAKNREGKCINCGKCCHLPRRCIFLKTVGDKSYCLIYKVRSLNCRKYPRTEGEFLTQDTCGYSFKKD